MRYATSIAAAGAGAAFVSAVVLKRNKDEPEPWACFMSGKKKDYMGTVQVSGVGQKCMQWSDAGNDDRVTSFAADTYNEPAGTKLEGNFCRAFADETPWCYTLPDAVKQDCNIPECPTDGPWAKDYTSDEVQPAIKCTDETGAPVVDCDCSCAGAAGTTQISLLQGGKHIKAFCHCPGGGR